MDGPYDVRISGLADGDWLLVGVVRGAEDQEVFRELYAPTKIINEIVEKSRQLLRLVRKTKMWDRDCTKLDSLANSILPYCDQ